MLGIETGPKLDIKPERIYGRHSRHLLLCSLLHLISASPASQTRVAIQSQNTTLVISRRNWILRCGILRFPNPSFASLLARGGTVIVPSVVSLLGVSGFRPGVRDINPGTKPPSHKKRPAVGIDCLEIQSATEDPSANGLSCLAISPRRPCCGSAIVTLAIAWLYSKAHLLVTFPR
ncbi:hypothetical protein BJ166DRAFT_344210 [Pestalotiopsis sp. NC0098]|nr:hypothetical protein BJ166DRAFT_344210 [Pestalotiopsis sp. NC0098]